MDSYESQLNTRALDNFREYLKIQSVHPNVNYDECVTFIQKQAKSLDLPVKIFEVKPHKPIIVITWEGTEPEKASILLTGHMDVVPAYPDEWKYPPFSAYMDENGDIYARGSQDCKCVSIQQIEAIRRLKLIGIRAKRTIHISFVPDEEIGGRDGMKYFTETQDFKSMNVGFALDEGFASPNEQFSVSYGERSLFQMWVHCSGNSGHGALLLDNTAGEKLLVIIDRFLKFRAIEKAKLKNPDVKIGDVTSVNLTMMKGGVQLNVIPKEFIAGFDIRLAADVNHYDFEQMIRGWCQEAGEGVNYTFESKEASVENTKLDDTNIFWSAFKQSCDTLNLKLNSMIRMGISDGRFLRAKGIPTLGFTPINHTPIRLHSNNEYLNKNIFLKGIEIFMKIIPDVANV